jgi:integrase
MPSIHRREGSKFWHAAFTYPDGRRALRSTGTSDKKVALSICLEWARASEAAREGRLTVAKSRAAIADIMRFAGTEAIPTAKVSPYLADWLASKTDELAEQSLVAYAKAIKDFLDFLGKKSDGSMEAVTAADVSAFRATLVRRVSAATANKTLAALRGAWKDATKAKIVPSNIFAEVGWAKARAGAGDGRRAFTIREIQLVLNACDADWRGMVCLGLYTGQRLTDLARLTWRSVDLSRKEITLRTRKTGRFMNIPIAPPLVRELLAMPSSDDPDAPIFPRLAVLDQSTLSGQFSSILGKAGLVEKKPHRKTGDGRGARRDTSGLCFHCLRHSATSMLKNAGVSDGVAQELIGHDSAAVSRGYTHYDPATLRRGVDSLPDILGAKEVEA